MGLEISKNVTNDPSFLRGPKDIVSREELFKFCRDWTTSHVTQAAKLIAANKSPTNSSVQSKGEVSRQQQIDQLKIEIDSNQLLLKQLDEELNNVNKSAQVAPLEGEEITDSSSDLTATKKQHTRDNDEIEMLEDEFSIVASIVNELITKIENVDGCLKEDLEATQSADDNNLGDKLNPLSTLVNNNAVYEEDVFLDKRCLITEKISKTKSTLQNRKSLLEDLCAFSDDSLHNVNISQFVDYGSYLNGMFRVNQLARLDIEKKKRDLWHPATISFSMERDSHAESQLDEYLKGDIIMPPVQDHEIDGFTDDSASVSASEPGEDASDAESDVIDERDETALRKDDLDGLGNDGTDLSVSEDDGIKIDQKDVTDDAHTDQQMASMDSTNSSQTSNEHSPEVHPIDTVIETKDLQSSECSQLGTDQINIADKASTEMYAGADNLGKKEIEGSDDDKITKQRILKRLLPTLFDPSKRSPVFFGYKVEPVGSTVSVSEKEESTNLERENRIFDSKLTAFRSSAKYDNEQEQGKLNSFEKKIEHIAAQRMKADAKTRKDLERARLELKGDAEYFVKAQVESDKLEASRKEEDANLQIQKQAIIMRQNNIATRLVEMEEKIKIVSNQIQPLGKRRVNFHKKELERITQDLDNARAAVAAAQDDLIVTRARQKSSKRGDDARGRAQVLYAEDQVKMAKKKVENVLLDLTNEEFLLQRAIERKKIEDLYLPLYKALVGNYDETNIISKFDTSNTKGHQMPTLTEVIFSLVLGCSQKIKDKLEYMFSLFKNKETGLMDMKGFMFLISVLFDMLERIGDIHPSKSIDEKQIEAMVHRAFSSLSICDTNSSGMSLYDFLDYCMDNISRSKYLCEIFSHTWKFQYMSEYQRNSMSTIRRFRLGMISFEDLKYCVARDSIQPRSGLTLWRKELMHERALAMGVNDPLKTDYTKYLPKTIIKVHSNVVALDHGGYKNLLYYRNDVAKRAAVRLQTQWRGRMGRDTAFKLGQKQAFYYSKGIAFLECRDKVEEGWQEKNTLPKNSVQRMKFEAKIRLRQVKLRSQKKNYSRDEVFELMMEEAVQSAQDEIEKRYLEMEEERGYISSIFDKNNRNPSDISINIIKQLEKSRVGSALVEKLKAEIKAIDVSTASECEDEGENLGCQEIEEKKLCGREIEDIKPEQVDVDMKEHTDICETRRNDMCCGKFPKELYMVGLSLEDIEVQELYSDANPPRQHLFSRLKKFSQSMTDLKTHEFLLELPSKRLICEYTRTFMDEYGNYNFEAIVNDLKEHFRIVRGADELAQCIIDMTETDIEYGSMHRSSSLFTVDQEAALHQLYISEHNQMARSAKKVQEKKQRMNLLLKTDMDNNSVSIERNEIKNKVIAIENAKNKTKEALNMWKSAEFALREIKKVYKKKISVENLNMHLPIVNRIDWMKRIESAQKLPEETIAEIKFKYSELHSISSDFLTVSMDIGRRVISEYYLPESMQTIPMCEARKVDGRDDENRCKRRKHYELHNIHFQLAIDDHGRFDGSDLSAAKHAGNDVRNSSCYMRLQLKNVVLPLQCVVDYYGFRVLCSAILPIDFLVVNDRGEIRQTYREHIMGSIDKGRIIVFQSKELNSILESAASKLNLACHYAKGSQDLTSKFISSAADLQGFLMNPGDSIVDDEIDSKELPENEGKKEKLKLKQQKKYCLLNFSRVYPPEDPGVTHHLTTSTRGMTILWRQLRPEFVKQYSTPLSPDSFSFMSNETPDWEVQCNRVTDSTKQLMNQIVPLFAKRISEISNLEDLIMEGKFCLAEEMHRHGINLRHLGYFRSKFFFKLSGTATLIFNCNYIIPTEDFTREIQRGRRLQIKDEYYFVSTIESDEFNSQRITLDRPLQFTSCKGVNVFAGQVDNINNSPQVRKIVLIEMVARTLKHILREYWRKSLKKTYLAMPLMMNSILILILNHISGSQEGTDEFWNNQVYYCLRSYFGEIAISSVEKPNLRQNLLPMCLFLMQRFQKLVGFKLRNSCIEKYIKNPNFYQFSVDDIEDSNIISAKHNLTYLDFSMASLLSVNAMLRQSSTYALCIIQSKPTCYWPLAERKGSRVAKNLGTSGLDLNGTFYNDIIYERKGPIKNEETNRAVLIERESQSYIGFDSISQKCCPTSIKEHISFECWARVLEGEGTQRTIITFGRLVITQGNLWAFVIQIKNMDIISYGCHAKTGKWNHVVGTYDGTCLKLYVDGFQYGNVEIISTVSQSIRLRNDSFCKNKADINKREEFSKQSCMKKVEIEVADFLKSEEGNKKIKIISQRIINEHNFRMRVKLKKNAAGSVKKLGNLISKSGKQNQDKEELSDQGRKNENIDFKKISKKESIALAKKQYIKEVFDSKMETIKKEFDNLREKLQEQIANDLGSEMDYSTNILRIGCVSSRRQRCGRHFFGGELAHVAFYQHCLSRDDINTHYCLGKYNRANYSSGLFKLASERFDSAIKFSPNNNKILKKYAENLCCSLKYDNDSSDSEYTKSFKRNVKSGVEYFKGMNHLDGIAEILQSLPKKQHLSDLFILCYEVLISVNSNYFQRNSLIPLTVLGRLPEYFFFGSALNASSFSRLKAKEIELFADIIKRVVKEYPTYYGNNHSDLRWIRNLSSPSVIVSIIITIELEENLNLLDFSLAKDISEGDLEIITQNNRNSENFVLDSCSHVSDNIINSIAKRCLNLLQLNIQNCIAVTDNSLFSIAKVCIHLQLLNTTSCKNLTDFGITAIAEKCHNLREVILSYCENISDTSLIALAKNAFKLYRLEVGYCFLVSDFGLVGFSEYVNCKTLKILNFAACRRISDEGIIPLVKKCTSLVDLNLFYCNKISENGGLAIFHNCLDLKIVNLQDLFELTDRIFYFDQKGDGRPSVDKRMMQELTRLNLQDCKNLTDNGIAGLCHRARKIDSINLSGCINITNHGLKFVTIDAFNGSLMGEKLLFIDLSHCIQLTESGILTLVKRCTKLRSFHVNGCVNLTNNVFIQVAKKCTGISSLGIGFCREITDELLHVLAQYLWLEELNLTRCNKVTDEGILAIAKEFSGLLTLNICSCKKVTSKSMAELLCGCTELISLDVRHCPFINAEMIQKFVDKKIDVKYSQILDDKLLNKGSRLNNRDETASEVLLPPLSR